MGPSERLRALLAGDEQAMDLDEAALELATLHLGPVDPAPVLRQLDDWANQIDRLLTPGAGGAQYLSAAETVLFHEAGLQGDSEDYYAIENSCLPLVMERRRGMPLTLAVIYLEVARRLARPVFGVALPAHFVCQYNDGSVRVFVDVFNRGRLLTEEDCLEKIEELMSQPIALESLPFEPCDKRTMVARMLRNFYGSYRRIGDDARAGAAESWLRLALP